MLKKICLINLIIFFLAIIFFNSPQTSYADYDSFTVNIPNSQGGYTSLIIKQSGTGYVGPRGEFYSNFPTVYQLQAVYGAPFNEIQQSQMIMQQADEQLKANEQKMLLQRQQAQQQQIQSVNNTSKLNTQTQPKQNFIEANNMNLTIFLFVIIILALYFLPSIVAFNRKHKNFTPIILVNFFLGWTFLGWIVALVWSTSHQEKKI